MTSRLDSLLGAPVAFEQLKEKPGRRRTLRAVGSKRTAIVKTYESARAPVVAARIAALADGPSEPRLPAILHVDPESRTVVLSEVPGVSLRVALLAGDASACVRAGAALARWHDFWGPRRPGTLAPHTIERELAILRAWAARAPIGTAVLAALPALGAAWPCSTVVHRDLYEEQVILGDEVGFIDLDDAALGPPELDVGNLAGHVDLLALRARRDLAPMQQALLEGYESTGARADTALLARCRALTLLRLACIHRREELIELARRVRA